MSREIFFKKKVQYLELADIANLVEGRVEGDSNADQKIYDVATLHNAKKGDISFFSSGPYVDKFKESKAQFCLVDEEKAKISPKGMTTIICANPYYAYSLVVKKLYEEREIKFRRGLFGKKTISTSAKIGKNCTIAPDAYIGDDVKIGDHCFIGSGAVILPGCQIGSGTRINSNVLISFCKMGSDCIIHSGARIGQDGFGFAHDSGTHHKIIQVGIVEIGHNVEIGANTCIDRGAIDNTKIGDGCKIDNLVQIAHNVEIGIGTVIAGCAAIAGSVKIGNYVQVGGNAGVAGHIEIEDQVSIAGMSGVTRKVESKTVVAGIPAVPIKKWHRMHAKMMKIIENK
ncbi:MAG: UDP-3-O-(3-hydroxymyristoyl)glucosamine N-acyltransferase [Rickettsiales bacterium]|nr:UDP-3-O-(3-hydroxymyristoyl)glucosamine N-acyltransferase [Rickettsiales bacterium]